MVAMVLAASQRMDLLEEAPFLGVDPSVVVRSLAVVPSVVARSLAVVPSVVARSHAADTMVAEAVFRPTWADRFCFGRAELHLFRTVGACLLQRCFFRE